ncbi:TolC family protein [bacterium]|nr:TolC family protein [bacterium]
MNTKKIFIVFFSAVFFCRLFFLSTEALAGYGSVQDQSNIVLLAQADTGNSPDLSSEIKNFIDEGRRFYRQRLYEKAIEAWEKVLKIDPENAKIKKYIARAKAKIGITSEVQKKQEKIPQTVVNTTDKVTDLIDQGRTYYRDGKYEDAIAVWKQAYKLDPENKRLQRYLMKAREKAAKEASKKNPTKVTEQKSNENAEQLTSKGKEYFRRGEYAKAIEQWQKVLALQPDDIKIQRYIEKAKKNLAEPEPAATSQEKTAKPAEQPAELTKPTEEMTKEQAVIDEETIAKEEQVVRRDLSWCVKIAIENHREARIAEEKIKKAKIDLFIARRNFFPNLFFVYSTAQGGSGSAASGSGTRDFVRNRYKFQASHMVYTGGKARSEVQKANIALDIEKKDYERIVGQKALEVAKAYYEVARTEADLKVQIDLLKEAKAALQLVEQQFKSGLVSELELLNLKAQINQLYSQVAAAQQEISHAVLDLQNVMNIDLTTPIRVYPLEDTEIEMDKRYADIPLIKNIQTYAPPNQQNVDEKNQLRQDSYVIFALKNRADFAVEQLKLEKASKDIDIAQSEFRPHFEVFGELGQGAEDTAQRLSDLDLITEYTAGVRLSWNIWGNTFEMTRQENSEAPSVTKIGTEKSREWNVSVGILDNLEPISRKQEFVVKHLEALNDLANQKNTIIEEVRDAYHNFLKAKIAKDTAKSKIEFRKKTVELYNLQRSLGELETSKLVQSEIDLATEKSGLHKALADYFIQLTSLDTSIGKNIFYKEPVSLPNIEIPPKEAVAAQKPQEDVMVSFTGYLFKLEKVTIGPATHKIVKGFHYRKWVALARSGTIDLNQYLGKEIIVKGIAVNTEDWIETVIVDSIELTEKQKIKDSKSTSKNDTQPAEPQPAVFSKKSQKTDSKDNTDETENKKQIMEKDNSA